MEKLHLWIMFILLAFWTKFMLAQPGKCEDKKPSSYCFRAVKNGSCRYKHIRKGCQRSCLVCCADLTAACKSRKFLCFHSYLKMKLRYFCPETCEYCGKAFAPPPCLDSKYGCCWDKSTPALSPIGSGEDSCPPCQDKQSSAFCNHFKIDCFDFHPAHIKGKQIRGFCPETCRVCGDKQLCMDDRRQAHLCPQYKDEGLCTKNTKLMKLWCPYTCKFCKPCTDKSSNCKYLKKHHACKRLSKQMQFLCPYTCNFC
ncbi:uncharacterized protein LOC135693971 [Rhopilema esculentum]|uniref:uncharacterized protein LOC135693971 n=1 Tax=Rhopilema esculentum TaxID=499914 RepID=UPI0031D43922